MTTEASPALSDLPDPRAADAEYYRAAMHELIDMGMVLARAAQGAALAQAAGPDGAAGLPGTMAAFDAMARTVRRCVVLARVLDQPVGPARVDRAGARRRVLRDVEDVIGREAGPGEGERLRAELLERLERPEFDTDLRDWTVEEVVALVCRDLGLGAMPGTRPWRRRTPADVAVLHARAAEVAVGDAAAPAGAEGASVLLRPARFRGK